MQQVFDVSRDPADKTRFLRGGFNMMRCPHCGFQGMAATPVAYHDGDKELLLTHVPMQLPLPKDEQERMLGRLINQVINALPAEKRKGYLLRPQTMLTLDGMVERVLEADGVTREMLDAQRRRLALIQELLRLPQDSLEPRAREVEAELDEAFFQLVGLSAASASSAGDAAGAQRLAALRDTLLPLSPHGRRLMAQVQEMEAAAQSLQALGRRLTRDKLLDLVVQAPNDERVAALISLARPAVDYEFFQGLTQRIERARGEDQTRLTQLRERVLELTRQLDEAAQRRAAAAADLLGALISAPDPQQAIRENLAAFDETFMAVLSANVEAAERAGRREVVERLSQVGDMIMQALAQAAPPALRLINALLETSSLAEAEALLQEHAAEIDDEMAEAMRQVATHLRESGQTEAADRLESLQSTALQLSMSAKWKASA